MANIESVDAIKEKARYFVSVPVKSGTGHRGGFYISIPFTILKDIAKAGRD